MEMPAPGGHGSPDQDSEPADNLVALIVNTLNKHLDVLSAGMYSIPITIATPAWLSGGTGVDVPQGCPLTPPIPVDDSCSNWHFRLPNLPDDLRSKKGKDVTVFVLDAFPEQGVIARAARDAGDDNLLLRKVNEKAIFDYSLMSGVQDVQKMADTKSGFVGKDVYGRHYPILLADHGLFIAGIIHDIARRASIECVRIIDDLCVGDLDVFAHALWRIYWRKALNSGDLYDKPVVINMSLVMPTDAEASSLGVDITIGDIWSSVNQPLRGLVELGVIVTASAGNEGDLRESPGINRPPALYPAAFAYPPYSVEGIIPVGAVDKDGNATSYSCYPGSLGVATYGGEVPSVSPPDPPSSNPTLGSLDALRGIYSSVEFPPLSVDPPEQYYAAPNDHAWAYWVGTSFATPIISALAARILEGQVGNVPTGVPLAILNAASDTTQWDRLDPSMVGSSTATGNMLLAVQKCAHRDHDEDDEDEEMEVNIQITEINVTIDESN